MTMHRSLNDILDECLDRTMRGESIDGCVADYPQHAAELREALEAAILATEATAFVPDPDKKRAARLRFLEALEHSQRRAWWRPRFFNGIVRTGPRLAATAAVALFALVGTGTGTVMASQDSAPGGLLYPVKRTSERVQLAFSFTDDREAELRAALMLERLEELVEITEQGREQFVTELVEQIEHHSERVQELRAAPVQRAVADVVVPDPTATPRPAGTLDPAVTPEPTPAPRRATPVPSSSPPSRFEVSIRPVITLDEELSYLRSRAAELQELVAQEESKQTLRALERALSNVQKQVGQLLEKADAVHHDIDDDEPDRPSNSRLRTFLATVVDVRIRKTDEGSVLDLKVALPDGSERVVVISRNGLTILKAVVKDLKAGVHLQLGVRGDGTIVEVRTVDDDSLPRVFDDD